MSHPPAGSLRDTPDLARRYSQTSHWQRERGLLLIDLAAPREAERVVDLGCGTAELSAELARRAGPSGRVIGIDPDDARLAQAKANRPAGLDNLDFERAPAETLRPIGDGSINLVYSNYAIHWVLDQPAMLDEVQRILRPGGRFVAEFLSDPIALFVELILLMPSGQDMVGENCFRSEAEWRALIAARDFEILRLDRPEVSLHYEGLASLFDWLEATSHGFFDAAKLTPDARRDLESRLPGPITCRFEPLRMALRRPS